MNIYGLIALCFVVALLLLWVLRIYDRIAKLEANLSKLRDQYVRDIQEAGHEFQVRFNEAYAQKQRVAVVDKGMAAARAPKKPRTMTEWREMSESAVAKEESI